MNLYLYVIVLSTLYSINYAAVRTQQIPHTVSSILHISIPLDTTQSQSHKELQSEIPYLILNILVTFGEFIANKNDTHTMQITGKHFLSLLSILSNLLKDIQKTARDKTLINETIIAALAQIVNRAGIIAHQEINV